MPRGDRAAWGGRRISGPDARPSGRPRKWRPVRLAEADAQLLDGVIGGLPLDTALRRIAAAAAALLTTVTWNLGERTFKKRKSLVLLVLTFVLMSIVKWPLYLVLGIVLPLGLFIYRPSASRQSGAPQ